MKLKKSFICIFSFLLFSMNIDVSVFAAKHVGLSNAGNSCYMNALCQQLYNLDEFCEEVLKVETPDSRTQPVLYSLQNIFKTMKDCPREMSSVNVSRFMRSFGRNIYRGAPGNSEFAFFQMVDSCDKEYSGDKGHFSKLFSVNREISFRCSGCNERHTLKNTQVGYTYDGISCGELDKVLSNRLSCEELPCDKCKKVHSVFKRETFKPLGKIFMLWIFCEHPVSYKESYTFGTSDVYKISGVIVGSAHHAYCYIKDKSTNSWYKCNDGSVVNMGGFENIKEECFSKRRGICATSVFYSK